MTGRAGTGQAGSSAAAGSHGDILPTMASNEEKDGAEPGRQNVTILD
jgi:hypothetical protein